MKMFFDDIQKALRNCSSDETIALIEKHPYAANYKDEYGRYLLHFACQSSVSLLVVSKLYELNKLALQQKDNDGYYPLQHACKRPQSADVILKLVEEFPQAVREKDALGNFPLHYACGIVQVKQVSHGYRSFISCSVHAEESDKVVFELIKEFPQAAGEINNNAEYPLHLACEQLQSDKVVLKVLEAYPPAAKEKDIDGSYPLHLACYHLRSDKVFLALINLNLMAVKHKNSRHRFCYSGTPLYIARGYEQSSTIIQILEELMTKSDYDLRNHIGIPKIVTINGLDNLRRVDMMQWVQNNSPMLINGHYIQMNASIATVKSRYVKSSNRLKNEYKHFELYS